MNNRIKEIIAHEHLSDGEFADLVGIKRSTLSHCLSGRNDVSKDIITKIHNAYPYISINWLMFGEGDSGLSSDSRINSNLFDSLSNSDAGCGDAPKYEKDFDLNTQKNEQQKPNNQYNISPIVPQIDINQLEKIEIKEKRIEKIMIFYSDSTFEVFKK
ncbi:MAG: helix-turn-helix transcriptional regulator [Bacteroidales bacterium]|nr:helix-turn-helix transcriptional regulator [Bacteroidales bacterium]